MERFDAIVVGVGGMGSAACLHLARRGLRVLGLEAVDIPHDRGSSHGQTRICRKAYFEHPDYVPLLHRSYELWSELEAESGQELFRRCGLVLAGPPEGAIIAGARDAAGRHDLRIEEVPASDWAHRFPAFRVPDGACGLFERDAGFLRVEACVDVQARLAEVAGATLRTGQRVRGWQADGKGVRVATERDTYAAGALVISAGAWTNSLLRDLSLPLSLRRKIQLWFAAHDPRLTLEGGCPVFGFHVNERFFYGFPVLERDRIKIAEHTRGLTITDPDGVDRNLRPHDVQPVHAFAKHHVSGVESEVVKHSVCLYTMTPDEHFIVDRHPEHEQVVLAAGFSGHGFKFAPLVGSVLADLVADGKTCEPVEFLRLSRFADGSTEV